MELRTPAWGTPLNRGAPNRVKIRRERHFVKPNVPLVSASDCPDTLEPPITHTSPAIPARRRTLQDTLLCRRLAPIVSQSGAQLKTNTGRIGMSMERTVLYRRDGRIARITLNRPEVLNAENMTFLTDLTEAVHALRDDREARVAIVTGAGRAFCSGVDLKALSTGILDRAFFTDIEYLWDILENCDKAVICGIHGYCLGGGLQIALACDLRVAAEDAVLGLPAVKECLIPGLGTYRLPRL